MIIQINIEFASLAGTVKGKDTGYLTEIQQGFPKVDARARISWVRPMED